MTKKSIMVIILLLLVVLSGCTTEKQKLMKVEVYSSDKQTLVNTIEDEESLATFNESTSFTEKWENMSDNYQEQQDELVEKLGNYEAQYVFITYQADVSKSNSETLEQTMEITVYENTNIIKIEVSPYTVKNFSIPSEYLTFYFETSDEVIAYLNSFV